MFEPGQSVTQGRGFLAPYSALDALESFGFNLLSLSNIHAFDLKDGPCSSILAANGASARYVHWTAPAER